MPKNSTQRFSNRVENCVKYRPDYPAAILGYLQLEFGLTTDKIIANKVVFDCGYTAIEVEKIARLPANSDPGSV